MLGRIGKPVRLRHGPATVIGEFFGTAIAGCVPTRWGHGVSQSLSFRGRMGRRRRVKIQKSVDLPR